MSRLAFIIFLMVISLSGCFAIFKTHMSNGASDDENIFGMHTVKIFSRETSSTLKGYSCSGSIIDYYWIITAGHCIDGFKVIDVFIGNVTNDLDHVVRASKVFIHPQFYHPEDDEIVNDIALIKLRRSLATLNNTFQIIPLPLRIDINNNFNGYKGIVSGYGKMGDSGPTSNFATFAYYEILSLRECQNIFLHNFTRYTQSNICAKGIDASSCEGDSGQGLVIYRKGKRKLIGVASKGLESCETIEPEVFTRVDYFLDWIENVIRNN